MVAQGIDTLKTAHGSLLKEVLLTDDKLSDWTIGASVLNLDSTLERYQGQDLASLLSQETHVRIRNYGALSSSSIRGAGAAHTQVVWNGLFLNSPMNGLYDLSLMPLFFISSCIFILIQKSFPVFFPDELKSKLHLLSLFLFIGTIIISSLLILLLVNKKKRKEIKIIFNKF